MECSVCPEASLNSHGSGLVRSTCSQTFGVHVNIVIQTREILVPYAASKKFYSITINIKQDFSSTFLK